ncbi:MAG: hypothetical protein H7Y28_15855 [Rhodoferax sp.]|nr:hypothetical protein [Rhodoferax sp.]
MRHTMRTPWLRFLPVLGAVVWLGACGGGGGSGGSSTPPPTGLTDAQRAQAATTTAQSSANACAPIRPFYWEIGDVGAAKVFGSVSGAGDTPIAASTAMPIASATKWLYASYIAEVRGGVLTASDIQFLNFRSGYTNFSICLQGQTVDSCLTAGNNGLQTPANVGKFFYDGGHMQKHASLSGLGALNNAGLAAELRARLGTDVNLAFSQPQPAGGGYSTAADYARVLRKMLSGQLRMGALLGSNPVCTNPLTCPQAIGTPIAATESWHYSVGHWVESDPVVGDGAFSSAGAFGFYPWIDASKTWYGVLARQGGAGSGANSVACGRLVRKAWVTGIAQ